MKRLKLFLMMMVLLSLMAAVVVFRSPYAPVAGGPVDIEVLWAIEDARTESEVPLITQLENHGVPLAYDQNENLFYCTLGLENGDEWPQLHLTAPGAQGVSICFSDDYTYDWCDEAIRKGYSYELMVYTDKEYHYTNIVFTGLPVLSLETEQTIADTDTPAWVTIGKFGEQTVKSYARTHLRGGLSRGSEKPAYKLEYTRYADGTDKIQRMTPGIGETDEFVLLPMAFDGLLMRDRLSWDVYGRMNDHRKNFRTRPTSYVEVIVNGEYAGVYLMMQPFDIENELQAKGMGHVRSDGVYRTCVSYMSSDRALLEHPFREGAGYEAFYSMNTENPFDALSEYLNLLHTAGDDAFYKKGIQSIDIQDMLNMQILLQAGGMTDNVFNNLYIWAEKTQSGYVYHYIPWDMDLSWGLKKEDIGEQFENWMYFPVADRLINLDIDQQIRSEFLHLWKKARNDVLNIEAIEALTDQYEHELNDSGAMRRNAECWGTEVYIADAQEILEFAEIRFDLLNETIERIAAEPGESALFLERTQYEGKGSLIEWE